MMLSHMVCSYMTVPPITTPTNIHAPCKEYILSICSENRLVEKYHSRTLNMLDARIPHLQCESGAVIERLPGDRLRLQGTDENIVRAQSLITMETTSLGVDADYYCSSENGVLPNGAILKSLSRTNTASPSVDFSDFSHADEVDGRSRPSNVNHGRQAEPPREVLQEKAVPSSASSSSSNKQEDIIALMQKLGYSRQNVEQVLQQIGGQPSGNEVLQMLVNLGQPMVDEDDGERGEEEGRASTRDASDGVSDSENNDDDPYRPIIIDGSNVAMSYGNANVFACKGIDTVVMWFLRRGHKVIYVFVPSWRKEQSKPETPIQNQEVLIGLEKSKILVWTPCRRVKGRRMVCYDDRYILNLATELEGIVVSNDTFRDLCAEDTKYRKVVEERLLMYSFAGDKFMPPDDPLGRHGPSLDNFLRKTPSKPSHQMQPCPYGKKCTYGNKCKYSHPERSKNLKPTSEILVEKERQRKEQKLKAELKARAYNSEPVMLRWQIGENMGGTEPLGNSMGHGIRASMAPPHGGAVTLPLANQPMPENTMKTVPLSRPQLAYVRHLHGQEDVSGGAAYHGGRGNMPNHNVPPSSDRWTEVPEQRVPPYRPFAPPVGHQTRHQHQHQRTPQPPNRASMTAPITGYAPNPPHQPSRDMMTAPLPRQEYHHTHAAQQGDQWYSLPGGTRDARISTHPPRLLRETNAIGDFAQEIQQMSLQDQSHGNAFDDDRHYSYPPTNPFRGSPNMLRHSNEFSTFSGNGAEDEGYFSPRKIETGPSTHPPPGYTLQPTADNIHAPQSHPYGFMYPSTSSTVPNPNVGRGQQQSLPSSKPTSPLAGGQDRIMGHVGATYQASNQQPRDVRRGSESNRPAPGWSEVNQERLQEAMMLYPREDDPAKILEIMKRGVPGKPQNQ